MLIFIENAPRAYAWGSRDGLPAMLGTTPTGEPQAELWLGGHPDDPATVAKGAAKLSTLIDLIEGDPRCYGVDGGQLPFLLKVLAIGAPLSLQVHPDLDQAREGYAAEEAAGVPHGAPGRNYGDPNHKPELLVALSEVTALSGFRPLAAARAELSLLAELAELAGAADSAETETQTEAEAAALAAAARRCEPHAGQSVSDTRRAFLEWALGSGRDEAAAAVRGLGAVVKSRDVEIVGRVDPVRFAALRGLTETYPDDPGVLVSLLLHVVRLQPGEAIYLGAQQLHAYLGGIGVEIMAASDNVLRAGLTAKHIDVPELLRIVDTEELPEPRFTARPVARGLIEYAPEVPDFKLLRARLQLPDGDGEGELALGQGVVLQDPAERVTIEAPYPLVLIVTAGRVRVERPAAELDEVASARRGQSLYVSAGEHIELTGTGEVFIATVGDAWASAQRSDTPRIDA